MIRNYNQMYEKKIIKPLNGKILTQYLILTLLKSDPLIWDQIEKQASFCFHCKHF